MSIRDGLVKALGGVAKGNLKEAIDDAITALRAEEEGWINLSSSASRPEPTALGRKTIYERAELYWFANPLIGQAVNLKTYYTFGRGVQITHPDQSTNKTLQRFWNDPRNKAELTSFEAQTDKDHDLQVYGNVFLVLFPQPDGSVLVRSFPAKECADIITDPEDGKRILWYKRDYSVQKYDYAGGAVTQEGPVTKYYRDWRYYLETEGISGYPVPDDTNPADPPLNMIAEGVVMHIHVNKLSHALFGVSDFYRAIDWAKAHKDQLEDWATIVRALSVFSWKRKSKSGADSRNAAARMGGSTTSSPAEKPASVASILHQPPNVDWEPISVPKGATTSPDDSRQLKLMVSAATGIFEHYFGDPSTGNLATSKSMELPMLKMFEARQQLWEELFMDLCEFVLRVKRAAGASGVRVSEGTRGPYNDKIAENVDKISVSFPPIVQRNVVEDAQALLLGLAATQGTNSLIPMEQAAAIFMSMMGVDDVQDKLEELKKEWEKLKSEADQKQKDMLNAMPGKSSTGPTGGIMGATPKSPARAGKATDLKTPVDKLKETAQLLLMTSMIDTDDDDPDAA